MVKRLYWKYSNTLGKTAFAVLQWMVLKGL